MEKSLITNSIAVDITDSIAVDPSGWDEAGDYGDLQLYNATLVVDTPKFKKGTKVKTITFLFTQSLCQIYDVSGPKDEDGFQPTAVVDEFPIKLAIVS